MLNRPIAIALLATLSATPALSAGNGEGFLGSNALRLGIGAGRFTLEDNENGEIEPHATGLEVFAGYEFNRWLAVEGGYLWADPSQSFGGLKLRQKTDGYYATVLGTLPVTENFGVYARAGLYKWDMEPSLHNGTSVLSYTEDGSDPIYGVGAALEVESALVRLEYRMSDLGISDLNFISLAIAWRIPLGR